MVCLEYKRLPCRPDTFFLHSFHISNLSHHSNLSHPSSSYTVIAVSCRLPSHCPTTTPRCRFKQPSNNLSTNLHWVTVTTPSLASSSRHHTPHQLPTMSSNSSYASYPQPTKAAYAPRPSTTSTCMLSTLSHTEHRHHLTLQPAYSSHASSSLYAQSGSSSRGGPRYSKPPVIHNGGGQIYDPNTSTSAPNGGYHS